jgi:hypothetical protein
MKRQIVLLGAAVLAATLLIGCGDSHPSGTGMSGSGSGGSSPGGGSSGGSSGGATMMSLDTAQVLALAQMPSDSKEPTNVDGGALTLNDTSDTTQPITVNSN